MSIDLGINSKSIDYEVAVESLGARVQPLAQMLYDERKKHEPSAALIEYCQTRINALDDLRENLRPTDLDLIERIIGGKDNIV